MVYINPNESEIKYVRQPAFIHLSIEYSNAAIHLKLNNLLFILKIYLYFTAFYINIKFTQKKVNKN